MPPMRHLSYANVVATLALFLALGGSAIAAKSVIDGRTVRKNSLPGDRVKKATLRGDRLRADGLTGREIAEAKLGKVPSATRADSADSAARAASADAAASAATAAKADSATNADHATAADTAGQLTGGFTAASFAPAARFAGGVGNPSAVPAQTIIDLPQFGLRVETDGDVDTNASVVVRNTGTTSMVRTSPSSVSVINAGVALVLDDNDGYSSGTDGHAYVTLQRNPAGGPAVILECWFPGGGGAEILTFCRAQQLR